MKRIGPITKYFQVSAVVAVFVGLAYLRQVLGYNSQPAVTNQLAFNTLQGSPATPSALPAKNPVRRNMTTPTPTPAARSGAYKDGTYTGPVADAYYGNVQVRLVVANGKIAQVNFLQYPNDNRTSQYINGQAMPMLQQEVLQAQSGNINAISGASATSQAFYQSLTSAIQQAQAV